MPKHTATRDIGTIDAELRSLAIRRRAARAHGGPLPSIDVADALLDARLRLTDCAATLEDLYFGCRRESA